MGKVRLMSEAARAVALGRHISGLRFFADAEARIAAQAGVNMRVWRRAAGGRPVAADAHMAICSVLFLDPVTIFAPRPVTRLAGPVCWGSLGVGLRLTREERSHSARMAAKVAGFPSPPFPAARTGRRFPSTVSPASPPICGGIRTNAPPRPGPAPRPAPRETPTVTRCKHRRRRMLDCTDMSVSEGVAFASLDGAMCRWPLWRRYARAVDGGRYCGAGVVEGAYCRQHASLAYAPPEARRAKSLSPFILPGVMSRPVTRQLDDLGSVQDGCKMSSDGQTSGEGSRPPRPESARRVQGDPAQQSLTAGETAREGARATPPAAPPAVADDVPFHDRTSQRAHYAAVKARLARGAKREAEPADEPAPSVSREEAALPAALPEADAVELALAGIARGPSNAQALHLLRLLLRDELAGRALYLYGPPGCGKSLVLSAARASLEPERLRLLDDAHDATEAQCRHLTSGVVRGLAVGRLPPSDCRAGAVLAGAVVVAIEPADPALCRTALEMEARRLVCTLAPPAMDALLALELPLPALLATLRTLVLGGGALDADTIAAHAARLAPAKTPALVRIDDVQREVCRHYDVTREDLLSQRRTASVVKPRQIAMYLAKVMTHRSLPEIGRRFGGRDHTTILWAVQKLTRQVEIDAALAAEVQALASAIRGTR